MQGLLRCASWRAIRDRLAAVQRSGSEGQVIPTHSLQSTDSLGGLLVAEKSASTVADVLRVDAEERGVSLALGLLDASAVGLLGLVVGSVVL